MDDWRPDIEVVGDPDEMPQGERVVLGILLEQSRPVTDRTVEGIAKTAGRDSTEVQRSLKQLEEDGYAECDVDVKLEVEFLRATAKAADLE